MFCHGGKQLFHIGLFKVVEYAGCKEYDAIFRVEIDLIEPGYIVQITGNVELPFMVAEQLVPDRNGIRKIQIVAFGLSVIDLVECGVKATSRGLQHRHLGVLSDKHDRRLPYHIVWSHP